ncbi:hypothetical protein DFA_07945 [Cavenderia fasciculata]|uniref:N-acetyltransferase domain-containing protein n=1 Tax=Cavenderia fasciculata TaxID=261658 RepID=F4Q4A2_CACFS|nr:uncharacterized protein DFA_07945 [Cavenderia fasciculata]EGG16964.1 hypothetical protein DFA_07945 [Cavenderia fasciculata]|eukprot:XP_004355438.1 hypothetical protein DFA_07945 [Cavenderia fasciculata]
MITSNNATTDSSASTTTTSQSVLDMVVIKTVPVDRVWLMRHIVMYPHEPFDFIKIDGDDTTALHYGVYIKQSGQDNNNNNNDVVDKEESLLLVSVVSLFVNGQKDEAQFRKFATLEQHQSRGYGTKLLGYLIEKVKEMGISKLWCSAREAKSSFYTRFGLIQVGQPYTKNNIKMIRMEMIINQQQ